ncbi:MAG: PDZ domain-containing protein [Planctomycetota bacterium]|jgi:serine protease Do
MKDGFGKLLVIALFGFGGVGFLRSDYSSKCCLPGNCNLTERGSEQDFLSSWVKQNLQNHRSTRRSNDGRAIEGHTAVIDNSLFVQQGGPIVGKQGRSSNNRLFQRGTTTALKAYREAIGDSWKATVQILADNKQLALGSIVRENGWISTKASEIPDTPIDVQLADGTKAEGLVKIRRHDLDIALIKIDRNNLPTIRWNPEIEVPLGGWLASADFRSMPLALGVVSVRHLSVRQERAVLGVQLSTTHDAAFVENVVSGSGAEKAGIRNGDIISEIESKELRSRREVLDTLTQIPAGHRVRLSVERDGKRVQLAAQMMDLSNSLLDPTEMEVNGSISARATGFTNIIQHDTVLTPDDCGGPLIDIDGNVVGMNIARAGRVSSYALPAKSVMTAIDEMLESIAKQTLTSLSNARGVADEVILSTANQPQALPLSVPPSIQIESLKPEVILPSAASRP